MLLGLVGAQSIAVVVALVARCVMKRHRHYEEYEEEQQVNKRKKAAAEVGSVNSGRRSGRTLCDAQWELCGVMVGRLLNAVLLLST